MCGCFVIRNVIFHTGDGVSSFCFYCSSCYFAQICPAVVNTGVILDLVILKHKIIMYKAIYLLQKLLFEFKKECENFQNEINMEVNCLKSEWRMQEAIAKWSIPYFNSRIIFCFGTIYSVYVHYSSVI
jgi:hypothetical protein